MQTKLSEQKTQMVFKIEKNPNGYGQSIASDCKFDIPQKDGLLYLNYEKRPERVVGAYKNLRQEGEVLLADVSLVESLTTIEHRFEYGIDASVLSKNDSGDATSVQVRGVSAIMHSNS
jgi:hypothetical protein